MNTLVLGGMRSGKSRFAQDRAAAVAAEVVVIATARESDDAEMTARIARHRADRPRHWRTVEEPVELAAALDYYHAPHRCLLVDCLTLWLTNLLLIDDNVLKEQQQQLLNGLSTWTGEVILVSNEVGLGVIPLHALARRFVDEAGRLNQALGGRCDQVYFVAAGLPLRLK